MEDFFADSYTDLMKERTAEHQVFSERLAEPWIDEQTVSGLTVPRYLDAYENEVSTVLHQSGVHRIHYGGRREFDGYIQNYLKTRPDSLVVDMLDSANIARTRRLYESSGDEHLGFAFIVYCQKLFDSLSGTASRYHPEQVMNKIDQIDVDEDMKRAFHAALDWQIYAGARNDHDIERGYGKTQYASSAMARTAMVSALDWRLLKIGLKDERHGVDLIAEYASSSRSRETMLGFLAMRAAGEAPRSTYGTHYQPRISPEFVAQVHSDTLRAKRERLREERDEHMRQAEEARKKADEAFRRAEEHYREYERQYEQYKSERGNATGGRSTGTSGDELDPVQSAIRRVAKPSFRSTLSRLERSKVQGVIDAVNHLRRDNPDITPRKIYHHFHYHAQLETADPAQVEAFTILDLLMSGDKSRAATLPF